MCICGLNSCQCVDNYCLLFVFFLKDSNIEKVAQILPNKFKLSIKKMPIFSINTLRNYKIFQAYGINIQQSTDIELLFQSINLEGQLCQVFIFLDKDTYEVGFSKSYFVTHKLYFQITTLLIVDYKNWQSSQEIKSLNMQFQSIINLTQGFNLQEKILQISDSFAVKVKSQQDLKKYQVLHNQQSAFRFQQSFEDFNHKVLERKSNSLEQIERLIRYLEISRRNLFYVSLTDKEQSYSEAIKLKFDYQVLKILSEFTEEILKKVEYLLKTNLQSIVQCKSCYSFGQISQYKELIFINTFSNQHCECPNSQQSWDARQNLIFKCNYQDIELSIQLLRKKYSIKYILTKFYQIQQDKGIQDQENTQLNVNENLKSVQENLAVLKTQRQHLDIQKQKIMTQNLILQQEKEKIIKQINFKELQIEECEQQSKKLYIDQKVYSEKLISLENIVQKLSYSKIKFQ